MFYRKNFAVQIIKCLFEIFIDQKLCGDFLRFAASRFLFEWFSWNEDYYAHVFIGVLIPFEVSDFKTWQENFRRCLISIWRCMLWYISPEIPARHLLKIRKKILFLSTHTNLATNNEDPEIFFLYICQKMNNDTMAYGG